MTVFTRDNLMLALRIKVHAAGYVMPGLGCMPSGWPAKDIADAINTHGLSDVIAGRHDGRAVTFAKAFELVYGERLTLKRGAA